MLKKKMRRSGIGASKLSTTIRVSSETKSRVVRAKGLAEMSEGRFVSEDEIVSKALDSLPQVKLDYRAIMEKKTV
jgi:hypothetical protein